VWLSVSHTHILFIINLKVWSGIEAKIICILAFQELKFIKSILKIAPTEESWRYLFFCQLLGWNIKPIFTKLEDVLS